MVSVRFGQHGGHLTISMSLVREPILYPDAIFAKRYAKDS
ncbi:hypothetical protein HMPREF1567_0033 [Providencia alcalifaciens PAL-2]|uniref:Uncharacterized protein n=1 Tax=Providencia alcalifaciens 205/92 TaxID=1256988 RepID=A0AAV3M490_9GAMM|nr:hypothetical protein HMPREF1567_0033 [Providencia alcalifaciens PAL-2]EUD10623.1 hypothetical protein HMPREF1563_1902 [Providencia alcalifaciens 205/92]